MPKPSFWAVPPGQLGNPLLGTVPELSGRPASLGGQAARGMPQDNLNATNGAPDLVGALHLFTQSMYGRAFTHKKLTGAKVCQLSFDLQNAKQP